MDEKLLREWNEDRNGGVDPRRVHPGSGTQYWWRCGRGHEWRATPATRRAGCSCPYCGNRRLLSGYNDFATRHPGLAVEWDTTLNNYSPSEFIMGGDRQAWWRCGEGHSYQATPRKRAQRGQGCPYCAGRAILSGYNDLASLNPSLMEEWDWGRNAVDPRAIALHYGGKAWWRCAICTRPWEASVANRARGSGCPACAHLISKEEKEVVEFIALNFPNLALTENDRTVISPREVDIILPEISLAIEYNGVHWHDKNLWLQDVLRGSYESREAMKSRSCERVGITLIHVWSDEWKCHGEATRERLHNLIGARL